MLRMLYNCYAISSFVSFYEKNVSFFISDATFLILKASKLYNNLKISIDEENCFWNFSRISVCIGGM